jgi:hypothetical protein
MKTRVLQFGWRLLLAVSLAASPWSSALSAVLAAQDAAQGEMPCHDHALDADETIPAGTDGCEQNCCPPANCGPASCVSPASYAVTNALSCLADVLAIDQKSAWRAPAPICPAQGERLRPPIR